MSDVYEQAYELGQAKADLASAITRMTDFAARVALDYPEEFEKAVEWRRDIMRKVAENNE